MATTKKKVLTAQLPPTPCTPQMRESLVEIAMQRNITIAEIQRQAFSLFLSNFVSETTRKVNTENI
jgi:hypothetical protein